MADERNPTGAPGARFEIPDLDLAPHPRPSVKPAHSAPPAARPVSAAPAASSMPFEDPFDAGRGAPVELQGGGGSAMDYFGAGSFDDDFALGGRIDIGVEAGGFAAPPPNAEIVANAESWPTGASPDAASIDIDPLEIDLLADYGKPPGAPYLAPLYAFRVFQRRRALRPALVQLDAQLADAERQRDRWLGELVQAHWTAIEGSERLKVLLEPVQRIDNLTQQRQEALAATNAEYGGHVAALDEQVAAAEGEIAELETVAAERNKLLSEREALFKRADARLKRMHIEMRSAREVAAQVTPPGGAPPPEHAARIQQLGAQAAAIQPEVDRVRQAFEAARADHDAVRAQISQIERRIRQVQGQRRALDTQFQKQLDARSRGVSDAEVERDRALADAARATLATRAVPLPDEDLERIRQADDTVYAIIFEHTKYLRALDAYDRETQKRGYVVTAAVVGAIILLIVILSMMSPAPTPT